jgi:hypothetical protein
VARLRIIGQDFGIARFGMESGGVLQMAVSDPVKALPFLRRKLKGALRLPERNIAIVGEPVRPARPLAALAAYLRLLGE